MIIDIVVIAFIVLLSIIGLYKGFMKMLLSLLGIVVTIVATIFLAVPFADFLSSFIPFDSWIGAPIEGWVEGMGSIATTPIPTTADELATVLTAQMGIPSFISSFISPWLFSIIPADAMGVTAASMVAGSITRVIVILIAAIILFILIRIAVYLLEKLFKNFTKIKFIGAIDRLFGLVLGAVKAYFIVLFAFTAMTAMMALPFMNPVAAQLSDSTFSKWIYSNNFITSWLFGSSATLPDQETTPDNDEKDTSSAQTAYIYDQCVNDTVYLDNQLYTLKFN